MIPEVVVDGTTGNEYRPATIDAPTARGSIVTSDDFIVDPDRLALEFPPSTRYTWATLHLQVGRYAAHLRDAGVQVGERIAILSDAPHDQALGLLGAMACGAVPTILSHPSIKQPVERFVPMFAAILQRDMGSII